MPTKTKPSESPEAAEVYVRHEISGDSHHFAFRVVTPSGGEFVVSRAEPLDAHPDTPTDEIAAIAYEAIRPTIERRVAEVEKSWGAQEGRLRLGEKGEAVGVDVPGSPLGPSAADLAQELTDVRRELDDEQQRRAALLAELRALVERHSPPDDGQEASDRG